MDTQDPNDPGISNVETRAGVDPPSVDDDHVLPEGTLIGRYVIKKVIGQGGMGIVYVAHDPGLNRRIAIKILNTSKATESLGDPESAKKRLLREAQAMAAIGHPNLVQVHDVGTFRDSVFIAMEFVNGRTLREWNAETHTEDWNEILRVYIDAGEALTAAHDARLIHRDFKPDNVILGFDSRVRVMDFGLARSTGARKADDSITMNTSDILGKPLTATGMIMGTPAYMAPEQFLGEPTDPRTDQFSFCVSLYEALFGWRPFQGKNMTEVAKAVMRGKIKLPEKKSPVPGYVLDALLRGLQCTPEDRHDSMAHLIDALREPPKRDFYHPWILYAVVGVIAASGLALYWYSAEALEEAREQSRENDAEPDDEMDEADRWAEARPGKIIQTDLDAVLKDHWSDVETCVNRSDHSDTLEGIVLTRFLIAANGTVEGYMVQETTLYDKAVGRCIMGMISSWRFPAPIGGPANIVIPIEIKP